MEVDHGQVFQALPAMVWTARPDGAADSANQRWSDYIGLSLAEAQSWTWRRSVSSDDLPALLERWRRILDRGKPAELEARIRRFDGQQRRVSFQFSPIRNDAGRVVKWCAVGTDVDDVRRTEEMLRRGQLDFQLVVDSIPIPVAVTTPTGEVEGLNRLTLEYFGKSFEELKAWKASEVVHPDDLERTIAAQVAAHEQGIAYNVESRHRRADGVYRWHNVVGLPLRDAHGHILRWFHLLIDIDDLKLAEDALRNGKHNLGLIISTVPVMAWTAKPDGAADFFNQQYLNYVGLSFGEPRDWDWTASISEYWDLTAAVHPDDVMGLSATWQAILASGQPGETEARLRRYDGKYRWFLFRANPLRDELGNITKWYGVSIDIDERRHAEETLRQSEARLAAAERDLQLTIDTIPVFVAIYHPDGKRSFVNQTWQGYTGLSVDEVTGLGAEDFPHIHPDDAERNGKAWKASLENGEPLAIEVRVRRADGQYRWYTSRRIPFRDPTGNIIRWYSVGVDIDDQKRAEQALLASEREARLIVDSIPGGIEVLSPAGEVEAVNELVAKYLGRPAADLQRTGLTNFIHPDDLQNVLDTASRSTSSGTSYDAEMRLRGSDGEYRWFQVRGLPLRDESGRIVRWYALHTDIDDRKRAEEALRKREHNFKTTIDKIPALAWSAHLDGSAEFLSQQYIDYIGILAEQAQGWGWTAAVHPDDLERLSSTWMAIMESGELGECEARLRRFDGEYRWLLFRAGPLRDSSGNIVKWYGVNTDIDDRKRAENNLAQEKHLLEKIASGGSLREVLSGLCEMVEEAGPGCYCDVHPIDWSRASIEYSVAPSLPASYTDPIAGLSVSGDALPCAIAVRQKAQVISEDMQSDPRWQSSAVQKHVLDHGLRSVWSTPIYAKDGHILGTLCLYQSQPGRPSPHHQDLIAHATHLASIAIERSRTEAALRRTETILAEAQQLSSTGSFSWRVDTDEVAFSQELYRIFEFDPELPVTLDQVRGRIHPDDVSLLSEQLARVRAGHDYIGYEIRLQMPDERVKYLRTFGRIVHHQDARVECLAAVQDVTERRLADEALSKARSELGQVTRSTSLGALTASIAHEVNQPLAGIITNASTCLRMLAADPPNVEVAQETARRTIRDGNRAADVIARLRALFSKRPINILPIDLNETAREVIALAATDLQRNRVILQTNLGDGLPLVGGDRVQLQQVIMNLLRNGAEAMGNIEGRAKRLMVKTEQVDQGQVRLSVRDCGEGFGSDGTDRLFDAFYTTKSDGMGMGLWVSRSIIESHHGHLSAIPNDGPGATFAFSIPVYVEAEMLRRTTSAIPVPVGIDAQNPAELS
jgi:PAS domain S-box-containing protein